MSSIVYGVSHGECSDYSVAAIFDSREKAVAWIVSQYARLKNVKECFCGGKDPLCEGCYGTGKHTSYYGDRYRVEEFHFNPKG